MTALNRLIEEAVAHVPPKERLARVDVNVTAEYLFIFVDGKLVRTIEKETLDVTDYRKTTEGGEE